MTPEFLPKLIKFLQSTKADPKYSRNLANFVKARQACVIYKFTYDGSFACLNPAPKSPEPPKGRFNPRELLILDQEHPLVPGGPYLRGQELWQAIAGGGTARVCNWTPAGYTIGKEITMEFWESYMAIGKCAIDHEHTRYPRHFPEGMDLGNRFRVIDDQTIQCKWCYDILHLHRSLDIRVRGVDSWKHEPVDPSGSATFRCIRCHRRHLIADSHQIPMQGGPGSARLCPSCYLAELVANPHRRKALLPRDVVQASSSVLLK